MPTELEMWLLFGYFVCNVPNKKIKKKKRRKENRSESCLSRCNLIISKLGTI